mmetsp:Transcript_52562/g.122283  ORF Transcript_52562/g.122283 Transcript_52562/m.122283 type:complete len:485 (-) Transcript_52562:70-1524(-)|eukprot:CAMPEP_0171087490 /NCGR_PEP_ID=MMETSP0766_2-20121228/20178_1 /TAXON_ID=439317 /ORGANISM="Gambierdiscus australes, Strain CAWD 149" /LENGTH=484 /DNA_ID=CAMNT_0011545193 /DNA_START=65 /DNA_END=1519 /DNA_ORIENTATION=+
MFSKPSRPDFAELPLKATVTAWVDQVAQAAQASPLVAASVSCLGKRHKPSIGVKPQVGGGATQASGTSSQAAWASLWASPQPPAVEQAFVAKRISTTVDAHRTKRQAPPVLLGREQDAGEQLDVNMGSRGATERKLCKGAATVDVAPYLSLSVPPARAAGHRWNSFEDTEEEEASTSSGSGRRDTVLEELASAALQAPLQLLSPHSSLATQATPPPLVLLPFAQEEEEQFMALLFPSFDSNAFVWRITRWQVAEFVLSLLLGHDRASPTPCVLYNLGASWGPATARGQLWRLVTPVMLHANLTHLLFNVFFQLRMGFGMEKQFGSAKMMLFYLSCGFFGNLMSVLIDPYKLAVGASTAGFGLIGVWLAEILLSWQILGPARERTIVWIAFMLISVTTMSSMTPNMDLYGHLGGALGGFLLAIVLADMREQHRPGWYSYARGVAALGLLLFLTGGLSRVLLFSPRDPIPNCPGLFPHFFTAAAMR